MGEKGTRVLFVDCAPFSGGAQGSLLTMVEALRNEGIEPFVANADQSIGGVAESCRTQGVAQCDLRTRHWSRSPLGLWQFLTDRRRVGRALRRLAGEWQPEIVHANTVRAALLVPGDVARAIPLVVHDRDRPAPQAARRLVAAKARRIVAISRAVAGSWPGGCAIVPNGLPVAEIARAAPLAEYARRVVLVADFVPWKRHDLFLRSFAQVRERRPEAEALLIGRIRCADRAWFVRMQDLAEQLGLSAAATFLTDVNCAWPHIAACRALASCAADEPFGRTVVEALALGKPVVAVRGGGPEEILGDSGTGVLVAATPDALADGLLGAWDWATDPARVQAAQQRAREFSMSRMVERIRDVYRTVQGTPAVP